MKILFIHPNMPGQYKHLARIMAADKNNQVVFITKEKPDVNIPNVVKVEYRQTREVSPEMHRYLINFERAVYQGQEVWRVCKKLKQEGFTPDVICIHPGWGDGLFLKDIYHNVPILSFLEFYYRANGGDVGFVPKDYFPAVVEDEATPDDDARVRIKNACNLFNLEICDWGITPTHWQQIQNPQLFRSKISVLHDGIDTEKVTPAKGNESLRLPNGKILTAKDEVVTYISRNFEPYRGFPTVMRAFKEILKRRPNCHIVCVGADGVSYGKHPPAGQTYRRMLLEELKPDMSRLHFIGYLPYDDMLNVLRISSAHIYLTVPFVLSWSMMESMAAECLMICSRTAPVLEVAEHEKNALLVDFFDHMQTVAAVERALDPKNREQMQAIRKAARQTIIEKYDFKKLLPMHVRLIQDVAARQFPPSSAKEIEAMNPPPKGVFDEWEKKYA